jgi:hypothetical protein
MQFTVVDEDHATVEHVYTPDATVAVQSTDPKDKPFIVMLAPPVMPELRFWYESTGASKVKYCDDVPATAPRVISSGL